MTLKKGPDAGMMTRCKKEDSMYFKKQYSPHAGDSEKTAVYSGGRADTEVCEIKTGHNTPT